MLKLYLPLPAFHGRHGIQDIPLHFCPTTDAVDATSIHPGDPTYLEGLAHEWSDDEVTTYPSDQIEPSPLQREKYFEAVLRSLPPQRTATRTVHMWLRQFERDPIETTVRYGHCCAPTCRRQNCCQERCIRLHGSNAFGQLRSQIDKLDTRVVDLGSANAELRT